LAFTAQDFIKRIAEFREFLFSSFVIHFRGEQREQTFLSFLHIKHLVILFY
jgi:hypothetical protein